MNREYFTHYSACLNREMHLLIYGHSGVPLLAFPCQDGKCDNWEGFHMPEVLSDYIESGAIQLFCVDTIDTETWSDKNGDKTYRAWLQEQYYFYIVNEVMPFIRSRNDNPQLPIVTGCSLGATHAAIVFLRRPDLFSGMLGLSGVYDATRFWDGWLNETLYNNSPVHFLPNLPSDHYYVDLYNQKKIIICVGQGAWEDMGIQDSSLLSADFHEKGIHAWVDFWGYDVNHDWPWWYKQIRYFMPFLLR